MNRNTLIILTILMTGLLALPAFAQDDEVAEVGGNGNGVCEFVDEDGDGFNDLAPDADGDGIPNGMDEDYVKPEDGTGNQYKFGQAEGDESKAFGEGMSDEVAGNGAGNGYGMQDGTGTGVGPEDGTGFGPGDGDCVDGEEPDGDEVKNRNQGGRN